MNMIENVFALFKHKVRSDLHGQIRCRSEFNEHIIFIWFSIDIDYLSRLYFLLAKKDETLRFSSWYSLKVLVIL